MIGKFLDVSTCYITEKDNRKLNTWDFPVTIYPYPNEGGYFIHCAYKNEEQYEELRRFGMSEEFIALMLYAQEQDCWFLRLDCDGDDSYDFPKFEW